LRAVVGGLAEDNKLPTENLLSPESLRRLAWSPPKLLSLDVITAALREMGARPWQIELVAEPIATALLAAEHAQRSAATDDRSD
jgi:ribonuclease D